MTIIARHIESLFFISLYDPSFSVDYFDFDTKIEAFLSTHPFLGINYKQSTIPHLASSKVPLIEAYQSKTSSKIKSVKQRNYRRTNKSKNFVNLLPNLMSDFLDLKLSMEEVFGERESATSWKRRGKH